MFKPGQRSIALSEIAKAIAPFCGVNYHTVLDVLRVYFEEVEDSVAKGHRIEFPRIGSFSVIIDPPRKRKALGKIWDVPQQPRLKFKINRELFAKVRKLTYLPGNEE